jgi:type IV pilus assembly protein PilP
MRKEQGITKRKMSILIMGAGLLWAGFLAPGQPREALGADPPETKTAAPAAAPATPPAAAPATSPSAAAPPAPPAPPVAQPAAPPAPAPAVTISAPPAVKIEKSYYYDPTGKNDPFKPFIDTELAKKKTVELSVNPLRRLAVEQFRLVGIIGDGRGRRAMVQDSKGKFYSLLPGDYIGLNNGRVSQVLPDSIVVDEKIRTDEGKIRPRKIIIKLHQGEEKP